MKLLCYTYEADYHCLDCARARFPGIVESDSDEYLDTDEYLDRWGNHPHPMYDTEEWYANAMYEGFDSDTLACGDCGEVIDEWEAV